MKFCFLRLAPRLMRLNIFSYDCCELLVFLVACLSLCVLEWTPFSAGHIVSYPSVSACIPPRAAPGECLPEREWRRWTVGSREAGPTVWLYRMEEMSLLGSEVLGARIWVNRKEEMADSAGGWMLRPWEGMWAKGPRLCFKESLLRSVVGRRSWGRVLAGVVDSPMRSEGVTAAWRPGMGVRESAGSGDPSQLHLAEQNLQVFLTLLTTVPLTPC